MTRPSFAVAVAGCLLLATSLAAQTAKTFVIPPSYASKPGNTLDQEPLGLDRIRHMQFVDVSNLQGLRLGATITEIRYRREEHRLDKVFSSYEPMRRQNTRTPNWQIKFGTFAGNYANLNPEYLHRSNVVSFTTVFAARLSLTAHTPTLTAPSNPANPAPFDIKFPFNVQSVLHTGAGIAIEHFAYLSSRARTHIYYVDAVQSQPNNGGTVDLISKTSTGCPANFNRVYGTAPNPGAGNVNLYLFGAPKDKPVISFLGGSATTWNGATLPLNLSFMSMGACNIYTDLTIPLLAKTDLAGIASISIPVPGNSAWVGATVYNQWAVADSRVNPVMGFAMSDGVKIQIGSQVGIETVRMSVISGQGNRANRRFGFLQPNRGAVFQLIYN